MQVARRFLMQKLFFTLQLYIYIYVYSLSLPITQTYREKDDRWSSSFWGCNGEEGKSKQVHDQYEEEDDDEAISSQERRSETQNTYSSV